MKAGAPATSPGAARRRWPGQDLVEMWRGHSSARSARWALIALLPRISFPLTVGALWVAVSGAAVYLASMVATGVLIGSVPGTVRDGFDAPVGRRLVTALVVVGVLFVYQQVLGPFQTLIVESLARKVNGELRGRVMRAAFGPVGIEHLERPELLNKIRDAQGVGEGQFTPGGAVGGIVGNLNQRLVALGSAVVVVGFRWWLALLLLGFGIVVRYRLVEDLLRLAQSGTGRTEDMRKADYVRGVATGPEAAKEARIFGLDAWLLDRFKQYWTAAMDALWVDRRDRQASPWQWSVPWGGLLVLALLVVGRSGVRGELSLQGLVIMAQACANAANIWISDNDIQMAYGATAVPAALSLEEALGEPGLRLGGDADPAGLPEQGISVEGLAFTYPGREEAVFDALDLFIPAGRSLAIVGENGAGKTTLVKLLARLYDPSNGVIRVDGTDLRELDAPRWQRRVAAIFQDFVHFELSARDNVRFGGLGRAWTDEELSAIAAKVGAAEMIERLPNGWDTVLSRRFAEGADLSGGQWQRLALARALCAVEAGAGVLILDEPTANLDVRAEAELFDQFLELTRGITTILISHRFSSVRHADLICVLDHGKVIETGDHNELMARNGTYARLFALQASRFTDGEPADA